MKKSIVTGFGSETNPVFRWLKETGARKGLLRSDEDLAWNFDRYWIVAPNGCLVWSKTGVNLREKEVTDVLRWIHRAKRSELDELCLHEHSLGQKEEL